MREGSADPHPGTSRAARPSVKPAEMEEEMAICRPRKRKKKKKKEKEARKQDVKEAFDLFDTNGSGEIVSQDDGMWLKPSDTILLPMHVQGVKILEMEAAVAEPKMSLCFDCEKLDSKEKEENENETKCDETRKCDEDIGDLFAERDLWRPGWRVDPEVLEVLVPQPLRVTTWPLSYPGAWPPLPSRYKDGTSWSCAVAKNTNKQKVETEEQNLREPWGRWGLTYCMWTGQAKGNGFYCGCKFSTTVGRNGRCGGCGWWHWFS